jgi:hypothetical protein
MVLRVLAAAVVIAAAATPAAAAGQPAARASSTARPAAAAGKLPTTARAALDTGRRYWGVLPCGGNVRVVLQRSWAPGVDHAADAWVTFDSSLGANNLVAPADTYGRCTIAFARTRWPTSASLQQDWDMFCLTMIHELGHLLGHEHDLAPRSVMAPVFTDRSAVPQICRSARPRR